MSLVELTEFLVKGLVSNPDDVVVNETSSDNDVNIQVLVKEEDMGAVIGKGGKIANAIRTLVQASAYTNSLGRVKITIDALGE